MTSLNFQFALYGRYGRKIGKYSEWNVSPGILVFNSETERFGGFSFGANYKFSKYVGLSSRLDHIIYPEKKNEWVYNIGFHTSREASL